MDSFFVLNICEVSLNNKPFIKSMCDQILYKNMIKAQRLVK